MVYKSPQNLLRRVVSRHPDSFKIKELKMCDFGLDDDIVKDKNLAKMLRWHGFLVDTETPKVYINLLHGSGRPLQQSIIVETKDGMVGDSGRSPLKSGSESCE